MPGTANISSGYTSQLQSKAANCDQVRLLARLQGFTDSQRSIPSTSWPPGSSTLERKAQAGCKNPTDVLAFPKKSIISSAYTLSLQTKVYACSVPYKYDSQCCPAPTITNAGVPKPSLVCSYTSDRNLNVPIAGA